VSPPHPHTAQYTTPSRVCWSALPPTYTPATPPFRLDVCVHPSTAACGSACYPKPLGLVARHGRSDTLVRACVRACVCVCVCVRGPHTQVPVHRFAAFFNLPLAIIRFFFCEGASTSMHTYTYTMTCINMTVHISCAFFWAPQTTRTGKSPLDC
jgi:hypothetical protein